MISNRASALVINTGLFNQLVNVCTVTDTAPPLIIWWRKKKFVRNEPAVADSWSIVCALRWFCHENEVFLSCNVLLQPTLLSLAPLISCRPRPEGPQPDTDNYFHHIFFEFKCIACNMNSLICARRSLFQLTTRCGCGRFRSTSKHRSLCCAEVLEELCAGFRQCSKVLAEITLDCGFWYIQVLFNGTP